MRTLSAILALFTLTVFSNAQDASKPLQLKEADARQQLIDHAAPIYPAIAKAAGFQGDVAIRVVIDGGGRINSATIVSGPPMLQQAALGAVRTWRFTPFQINGATVWVSTTLTIPFSLPTSGPQPSPAQEVYPLGDKCRAALRAQDTQASLSYCKQALDKSIEAGEPTSSDRLVLVGTHESYGQALLAAGRLQEAFDEENKAIEKAKVRLKPTDEEYAMPFYWRAKVEESLGNYESASADFTVAEETLRKAIASLPEMEKFYGRYLAAILNQHGALLEQMGKTAEAAKLRDEAASLPR